MDRQLSKTAIGVSIGVVAVVLIAVFLAITKPSFTAGPVVEPRPFTPPAGARNGFGKKGPIGAPAQAPANNAPK
jgi:hypothetical protein